ncbi:hypothetical protein [Acinetobacter baumannii]|uniref:hypothetical protein n=1 Tax=Acinetobacter baumannii TaxID=470 RepID=UPI0022EA3CB3|nr:hypothetical protein [Acinetobacter baumannii]MDA3592765.1 hypothetical protein [Acinetobacter baumannii]
MEKFEEYFRTTKHYENMLLDIARNQLSVSVFDKNGRKYRNHIVQTAYEVFQHQQAKVEELQTQLSLQRQRVKAFEEELTSSRNYGDELQKRVDAALKETQFALQYVEEDMRGNHEFLQMAMIRTFKALEQVLKGEG